MQYLQSALDTAANQESTKMKYLIKAWLFVTTPIECRLGNINNKFTRIYERVVGEMPYYTIHDFNNKLWRNLDKVK